MKSICFKKICSSLIMALLLTLPYRQLSAQCMPDMTAPLIDISGVVTVGPYTCEEFNAGIPPGPSLPYLDFCDNIPGMVSPVDDNSGVDACNGGIIVRTWTVQDIAGNIGAFTQMINVLGDTDGPTWDQAAGALDASFDCTDPGVLPAPTATDNCGGVASINITSDVVNGGSCANDFTRVITYQATDACGNNSDDFIVSLTIQDATMPTADALADLGPFACYADIPAADINDVMNAADNCGGMVTVMHEGDSADPGCAGGIVTRTYSVTDVCGNSLMLTQNITVSADNTAPTADALADIGPFACYADIPAADINDVMNEMDNCGAGVTVTHVGDSADPGCAGGNVVRTYQIEDACGNTSNVTQNITVSADNTAPTADALPDLGPFACYEDITPADITAVMNASDNCGGNVTVTHVGDDAAPGCAGGTITRTYRIEDACGNSDDLVQNIMISQDNVNPTVTNMTDGSITTGTAACPGGIPAISLDADIEIGSEEMYTINGVSFTGPMVGTNYEDNCTANADLILRVDDININAPGTDLGACVRWIEITYSVQDLCNNFNFFTQRIRIEDEDDPTFTLAANNLDRTCSCEDMACLTAAQALAPTAADIADNCPSPVLGAKNAGAFVPGATCPQAGTYTNTWEVTDACGNTASYTQVITILDMVGPTIDNTGMSFDVTIDCDDPVPPASRLDAMDSCDPAVTETNLSVDDDSGVDPCTGGVIIRTWTAADACGTMSEVQQMIHVNADTTAPSWTGVSPQNLSADCGDDIDALIAANIPSGTDNCNTPSVNLTNDAIVIGACAGDYVRTLEYEISDDCGNVNPSSFEVVITVTDNTPPSWTGVSPTQLTADCGDDIDALAAANVPIATDDCSAPIVSLDSDDTTPGACAGNYVRTLTYSAADDCGNAATTTFVVEITVSDTTAPTWDATSPLNLTADCTDDIAALIAANIPSASDDCGTVTVSQDSDNSVAGTCAAESVRTISYEVMDDCGNTSTDLFEVIITIEDTAPSITCQDITVDLDAAGTVSIAAADVLAGSADDCGTVDNLSLDVMTFTCSNLGANVVTLTATDDCGNTASCTATVTVNASTACTSEISIDDPCSCKNNATTLSNGQFEEMVTVTAPTGQTWTVSAVTGLYTSGSPNPPIPPTLIPIGTALTETPPGSGQYILNGIHVDGIGFSIEVTNGLQTLDTTNTCFYPNPQIEDLAGPYCLGTPAITLSGNADPAPGTGSFTIDGSPAVVFDPAALGLGSYVVEYTFDGDSIDVNNPGCIQAIDQFVDVVATPSSVACQDTFNVSLDDACVATIRPDVVVIGTIACYDDYVVNITYPAGTNTYTPADQVDASHIGMLIPYAVTNTISGVTCEGFFRVFDLRAPVLSCENDTVNCKASLLPADLGFPTVTDNCSSNISLTHTDIATVNGGCNDPFIQRITRRWIAVDESNNRDTCLEFITVSRDTLTDIVFPDNLDDLEGPALSCDNPSADPSITGRPMIHGEDLISSGVCGFDILMEDDTVTTNLCEGTSIIFRKWTIFDCAANSIEDTQIIKILDKESPTIVCPSDITVSTGPDDCTADVTLLPATVSDNCSSLANITVTIVPDAGTLTGNVLQNVPLGMTDVHYIAEDDCGNRDTCTIQIEVIDLTPPKVVCDLFTTVSLIGEPTNIPAAVFDSGSSDNCSMTAMLVSRMDEDQCAGNDATNFGPTVPFYCCDAGDTVRVILQVTDQAGNINSCMVQVLVQDKLNPSISCPPNITLDCGQDYTDLSLTGNVETDVSLRDSVFSWVDTDPSPTSENWVYQYVGLEGVAVDNCGATVSHTDSGTLDNCGLGTITRIWTATDPGGRTASCLQQITFVNTSPFNQTNITWPSHYTTNICGAGTDPDDLPAPYNGPVINSDNCDDIFVGHDDLTFNQVDNACVKILRTWVVIDWCQYDPNNPTAGGRWEDTQVIKIMNDSGPVFLSSCSNQNFSTTDAGSCSDGLATLVAEALDDCTALDDLIYSYQIDLLNDGSVDITGNGNDASGTYGLGTHMIIFTAEDDCGNTTDCSFLFSILDGVNPVAKCKLSETVTVPITGVEIPAINLNEGSFDNCSDSSSLTYLIQHPALGPNQTMPPATASDKVVFTCLDFINNAMRVYDLWVQDETGNWDYCTGTINLQGICFDPPSMAMIAGHVENEYGQMVDEVNVELDGYDAFPILTDNMGTYAFDELPTGNNYGIVPEKNINLWNGVTSFDLVVLGKHLLNVELIDSPYRRIAADVDKSGNIDIFDLIELRKLILHLTVEFPNGNQSWRFVPSDYVFPNYPDPFTSIFPEVYTINGLTGDMMDANFIGIKTGDVSGNAIANNLQSTQVRNTEKALAFSLAEQKLEAQQQYKIDFRAKDFSNMLAYQFTLNFDKNALNFIDLIPGNLAGLGLENFGLHLTEEGFITASWSHTELQTLEEDAVVFSIVVEAKDTKDLSTVIGINSRYTTAEAYTLAQGKGDVELLSVALDFETESGNLAQQSGFELYQNRPNPFKEQSLIGFYLPEATKANLSIYDTSGKLLKVYQKDLGKGYHEISIDRSELPSSGVLYYQLATPKYTALKKMILLD